MGNVRTADDIKPDFEGLKSRWEEMLAEFFFYGWLSSFEICIGCSMSILSNGYLR